MSSAQRLVPTCEEKFSNTFNYSDKRTPHGETLSEIYKSCLYIESSPILFSFSCTGPRNLTYTELFEKYIAFVKGNLTIEPIKQSIFPIFCHIIMIFRQKEQKNEEENFIADFLKLLPDCHKESASEFIEDPEKYRSLSCLLSTQRYIIHCTDDEARIFNEFLNQSGNSQLRSFVIDKIILDPIREELPENRAIVRFPLEGEYSSLGVLQARIRSASYACIAEDASIFAAIGDQNIIKIDYADKQHKLQNIFTHGTKVTTLSLSQQSNVLLSGDLEGHVHLWTNSNSATINAYSPVWCSCFPSIGGVFAIGSDDNFIRMFETPNQKLIRVFAGHRSPVTAVTYHPNCAYIGSCAMDLGVRIWDTREARSVRLFISKYSKSGCPVFSPNGRLFAFFDGDVNVYDFGSGNLHTKKSISIHDLADISFSVDSRFLYAAGINGEIYGCDLSDDSSAMQRIIKLNERVISCSTNQSNELRVITTYEPNETY